MDIASFVKEQWQAVANAPLAFALFAIVLASIVASLTRVVMGGTLDAARERLLGAKDEIQNLKAEKSALLQKLESHGEDIASIKAELAAMPRIHVSDQSPRPNEGRDGDLFFVVDK